MTDVRYDVDHSYRIGGTSFQRLVWMASHCFRLLRRASGSPGPQDVPLSLLELPLTGLGAGWVGAKLVHLTDLHCGPAVPVSYLTGCVDRVNEMDPDFVVVTGDLITAGLRRYARVAAEVLSRLRPTVAAMVVLGNHDYGLWHPNGLGGVRGLAEYVTDALEDAGLVVLANESRDFFRNGSAVQFVGTEDLWSGRYDADRAFAHTRVAAPAIALTHNPDAAGGLARRGAQWILAGHTHGRRTPNTPLLNALFPTEMRHFVAGQYALGGGSHLYVNTGLSYSWRRGAAGLSEIALFTLRSLASGLPVAQDVRRPVGVGV